MTRTLDMQYMRYINLFSKISRVMPSHCFPYNNMLIFVVPKKEILMAIGRENTNLKKVSQILKKRIRVVAEPKAKEKQDIKDFVTTIISPVDFNEFDLKEDEVNITAGRESKARLIGRGRIRQKELQDILEQYFGIKKINII